MALHGLSRTLYGCRRLGGIGGGYSNEVTSESTEPGELDDAALLPLVNQQSLNFVTRILERTTLYNSRTVFVTTEPISFGSLSYSNVGGLYYDDRGAAERLIDVNRRHFDLVARGLCAFVPPFSSARSEGASGDWGKTVCEAPLEQPADGFRLLPLNASSLRPEQKLSDALIAYKDIVLPYFSGLELATVARIAETETEAFRRFNRVLRQMLAALPDDPTQGDLASIVEQLDDGIDRVAREAKRLAALRSLRHVEVGFFSTSVVAFLSHVDPAITQLSGLIGSASLLELVRSRFDQRHAAASVAKSDFYVPYLLDRATR